MFVNAEAMKLESLLHAGTCSCRLVMLALPQPVVRVHAQPEGGTLIQRQRQREREREKVRESAREKERKKERSVRKERLESKVRKERRGEERRGEERR